MLRLPHSSKQPPHHALMQPTAAHGSPCKLYLISIVHTCLETFDSFYRNSAIDPARSISHIPSRISHATLQLPFSEVQMLLHYLYVQSTYLPTTAPGSMSATQHTMTGSPLRLFLEGFYCLTAPLSDAVRSSLLILPRRPVTYPHDKLNYIT